MVVEGFSQFFGAGRLWNARESVLVPAENGNPRPCCSPERLTNGEREIELLHAT